MFVCVCRAVTEAEVRATIEAGARTVDAVTSACRAGEDCGACHGCIEDMIEEHAETLAEKTCPRRLPLVAPKERAA